MLQKTAERGLTEAEKGGILLAGNDGARSYSGSPPFGDE
jgi:hypothetical protein